MSGKSYKEQNRDRRDFRQAPLQGEAKPHNHKKDRKKWCKGKSGVQHKLVCQKYAEAKHVDVKRFSFYQHWRILVCEVCGKEISHYFPFGNQEKPEWVDK